jgi:hypothetical protein
MKKNLKLKFPNKKTADGNKADKQMKQKNSITKGLGPKSKLNKRTSKILTEALRQGLAITRASVLAKITPPTFYRWLEYGQKNVSEKYRNFYLECEKAEVEFEESCLKVVRKAINGDLESTKTKEIYDKEGNLSAKEVNTTKNAPSWTAAMTFLERKYPERWGRHDRIRLGGDPEFPIIPKQEMLDFLTSYIGKENIPIDVEGRVIENNTLDMRDEQEDDLLKENR